MGVYNIMIILYVLTYPHSFSMPQMVHNYVINLTPFTFLLSSLNEIPYYQK